MTTPRLPKPSWLGRLGLAATSMIAIVAGFALASLLFTVVLVAGLVAGGWLWWQFHRLARRTRASMPTVLEGEYTVDSSLPLLEDGRAPPAAPPLRHD
jgi:hypothetical protein